MKSTRQPRLSPLHDTEGMWGEARARPQSPRLEAAAPSHGCFCLWPVALPLAALPGSLLSCIPQAFPSWPWHSSPGPPIKPQPSSSVSASACQVGGKGKASVLKGGEGVTAAALEGVVGVFEGLAGLFASVSLSNCQHPRIPELWAFPTACSGTGLLE